MKIYAGTSGYGYREWKGKFYPEKISPGEMLRFYSARLNSVEINNTFYRMPKQAVLTSWAEQVPDGFVFAIKAPQVITHLKRLKNAEEETRYFLASVPVLDAKLGPILFQFSRSFRPELPVFRDFLALIPKHIFCAFEFREPGIDPKIKELLIENGCSVCIADTDENPAHEIAGTAGWGYLRLRRSDYSDRDLSVWMERIHEQHWDRVFVFFKHEDEAKGPKTAMRFRALSGEAGEEMIL